MDNFLFEETTSFEIEDIKVQTEFQSDKSYLLRGERLLEEENWVYEFKRENMRYDKTY